MKLALSTSLQTTFDEAVERTREALAAHGFGVLTEIDMQATLQAKLGVDMENFTILGACNPPLAHRAVSIKRQIGLMLPCNVVVRTDPDDESTVLVEAMNPKLLVDVTPSRRSPTWPTKSPRSCKPRLMLSTAISGAGGVSATPAAGTAGPEHAPPSRSGNKY